MEYKVAYNSCYGGYNFSDEALEWFNKEFGTDFDSTYRMSELPRHDSRIIQCIEELGADADAECASLMIETIESPMYFIEEYDGSETVMVPDSIDWTIIE